MSETTPAADAVTRSRMLLGAAAAAVLLVALGAFAVLRDDSSGGSPLQLSVAGGAGGVTSSSCIQFDPSVLGAMQIAFDGTATEVTSQSVTLDVSHWYKGGTADTVELAVTTGDPGVVVSIDGVEFTKGERYLISASDGAVSTCGFSGPWSAEYETSFQHAFSG